MLPDLFAADLSIESFAETIDDADHEKMLKRIKLLALTLTGDGSSCGSQLINGVAYNYQVRWPTKSTYFVDPDGSQAMQG